MRGSRYRSGGLATLAATLVASLAIGTAPADAGLTLKMARKATARYGDQDIRRGQASGYTVGECHRRRARVAWCWLTEYDVPLADLRDREFDRVFLRVWIRERRHWITGVDDVFDIPERRLFRMRR